MMSGNDAAVNNIGSTSEVRTMTLHLIDLTALEDEFQFEPGELDVALREWEHRAIRIDDRLYVTVEDWRTFVREIVRRAMDSEEQTWRQPTEAAVPRFRSQWNERRRRMLERDEGLRELLDRFLIFVSIRASDTQISENASTITFLTQAGGRKLRSGLRLRGGRASTDRRGLLLIGTRPRTEPKEREVWVRSESDFGAGLEFIQGGQGQPRMGRDQKEDE